MVKASVNNVSYTDDVPNRQIWMALHKKQNEWRPHPVLAAVFQIRRS